MKNKIQIGVGAVIVLFLVFSFFRSVYNRNFAEPEFKVLKEASVSNPIKNALFWYEQELEKITFQVTAELSSEGSNFTQELYKELKNKGLVNDEITTMSEVATKKMIELDAYRGTEPNVLEIAQQKGYSHIFKVIMTHVDWKRSGLSSVTYQFGIYDIEKQTLIWKGEMKRLSSFFSSGMPNNEKSISVIEKQLKEAKIIE